MGGGVDDERFEVEILNSACLQLLVGYQRCVVQ